MRGFTYYQPIKNEINNREEALEQAIKKWMNKHYAHGTSVYYDSADIHWKYFEEEWYMFEEALNWGE